MERREEKGEGKCEERKGEKKKVREILILQNLTQGLGES